MKEYVYCQYSVVKIEVVCTLSVKCSIHGNTLSIVREMMCGSRIVSIASEALY